VTRSGGRSSQKRQHSSTAWHKKNALFRIINPVFKEIDQRTYLAKKIRDA
jgi:hypothetical protein